MGFVSVQLPRALAGPPGFATGTNEGREHVDQREQLRRVVGVGGREADGERDTGAVDDQVIVGTELAPVDGAAAGLLAPFRPGH